MSSGERTTTPMKGAGSNACPQLSSTMLRVSGKGPAAVGCKGMPDKARLGVVGVSGVTTMLSTSCRGNLDHHGVIGGEVLDDDATVVVHAVAHESWTYLDMGVQPHWRADDDRPDGAPGPGSPAYEMVRLACHGRELPSPAGDGDVSRGEPRSRPRHK